MLTLRDVQGKTLNQWPLIEGSSAIGFRVHQHRLLDHYEDQQCLCVFYGFLDQDIGDCSAADFIAHQLQKNEHKALEDFYGSFIIIYYCKRSQSYLVANDALGDFAVHYYEHGDTLYLSELPEGVLTENNRSINDERLLHYFALSQPLNQGSFFSQIKQLNPGQYLQWRDKKLSRLTYYQLPTEVNWQAKNISELSNEFTALIQSILALQTRGHDQVGLMMSGGLDSTFVAVNSMAIKKTVKTFSYVFPQMPEANESLWIDAMRNTGLQMNTFSGETYWPLKSPWFVSLNAPVSNPYRHLKQVIYQRAEGQNISVMLSGVFADHLYSGYIYWLIDQIMHKPWLVPRSLWKMLRCYGLKATVKQIAPGKWSKRVKSSAPWLNAPHQAHLKQKQRNATVSSHPHAQQYALVSGLSTAQSCWLENEYAFKHNINMRHPFRDRRVVEFLLSIPAWVLGDYHQAKRLIRQTAKDLLPDNIIARNTITTLKPLFIKGVLHESLAKVKTLLNDSHCNWQDFIDKKVIDKMLKYPGHDHKDWQYMILWQCLSYELWKRRLNS